MITMKEFYATIKTFEKGKAFKVLFDSSKGVVVDEYFLYNDNDYLTFFINEDDMIMYVTYKQNAPFAIKGKIARYKERNKLALVPMSFKDMLSKASSHAIIAEKIYLNTFNSNSNYKSN